MTCISYDDRWLEHEMPGLVQESKNYELLSVEIFFSCKLQMIEQENYQKK